MHDCFRLRWEPNPSPRGGASQNNAPSSAPTPAVLQQKSSPKCLCIPSKGEQLKSSYSKSSFRKCLEAQSINLQPFSDFHLDFFAELRKLSSAASSNFLMYIDFLCFWAVRCRVRAGGPRGSPGPEPSSSSVLSCVEYRMSLKNP